MTQASPLQTSRSHAPARPSRREMAIPAAAMWAFPLLMLATIAGVMTLGVPVTYASALVVAGSVIWYSLRAQWLLATGFYFTYAALEGLYKYTTDFSSTFYALKPILVIFMAFLWWLSLKIDGRRVIFPPLTGLLGVLACLGFVQVFHPLGSGFALGLVTLFLWYLAPTFFYFLICNELKTPLQGRQIFIFILAIASVVSLFSAFQYALGEAFVEAHLPGYARLLTGSSQWWLRDEVGEIISSFRPASTTAYTGAAATWSFIGILLSCSTLLEVAHRGKRALLMGLLLINSVGLIVTAVRLWVIVAIICIALLLILTSRSPRQLFRNLFVLALFSVIAVAGFFVSEVFSGGILQMRYAQTLADPVGKAQKDRGKNFTFLPTFVPRYPLGIGFQRSGGLHEKGVRTTDFISTDPLTFNRETQFNAITADLGVAGLILFFALAWSVLRRAYLAQRHMESPAAQQLGATLFCILFGYVLAGLGGPSLQGSELFYLLAALATTLPALPGIAWSNNSKSNNSKPLSKTPRLLEARHQTAPTNPARTAPKSLAR